MSLTAPLPENYRMIQRTWSLGDLDACETALREALAECRQAVADGFEPVALLQCNLRGPESGEGEPSEWVYEFHAQYRRYLEGERPVRVTGP